MRPQITFFLPTFVLHRENAKKSVVYLSRPAPTLAKFRDRGLCGGAHTCPPFSRAGFWALRSAGCATWTSPGTSASPNIPSPDSTVFLRRAASPPATTSGNPLVSWDGGEDGKGCSKELHPKQQRVWEEKVPRPLIRFLLKIRKDFPTSTSHHPSPPPPPPRGRQASL